MTRITLEELHHIQKLYTENYKQKEIKLVIDRERQNAGVYTGKGISTNTISQLSPNSKHRDHRTASIHDHWEMGSVLQKIVECMKCDKKDAKKIFNGRILPLTVARFHSVSGSGLISIRHYALACNSTLYYIFTTEDYAETMGLDPSLHEMDVWTVKTEHTYIEVLNGSLTREDIESELRDIADNEYLPDLVTVCILKA